MPSAAVLERAPVIIWIDDTQWAAPVLARAAWRRSRDSWPVSRW